MKLSLILTLTATLILAPVRAYAKESPAPADSVTTKRSKKLGLFIGDSITDGGWGRSGGKNAMPSSERNLTDLNHLLGHSYVFSAVSQLTAERPDAGYDWANRGISGDRLDELEKRWDVDVTALRPDILTMMVGTNDVLVSIWENRLDSLDFTDWHARYRALIDRARSANPEMKVVLITPFVYPNRYVAAEALPRQREAVDRLAEEVRGIADETGATLIDANRWFDPLCERDGSAHWVWDGIHPSPAGHYMLAQWWLETVEL